MAGPRIPFSIPKGNGPQQTPQTTMEAEESMEYPRTQDGFWQSHNGRQRRWDSERPRQLANLDAPRDIYVWKED